METLVTLNLLLWQLLHRTSRAIVRVRQRELDRYGITVTEAAVLQFVVELMESGKRPTPTEIARQLFLETNSMSEQLKRMESGGLVRKVKDPAKRNKVRIEVTTKGYDLYRKTLGQDSINAMISELTPKEKSALWALLVRLRGKAAHELGLEESELYPPSDYPHD